MGNIHTRLKIICAYSIRIFNVYDSIIKSFIFVLYLFFLLHYFFRFLNHLSFNSLCEMVGILYLTLTSDIYFFLLFYQATHTRENIVVYCTYKIVFF